MDAEESRGCDGTQDIWKSIFGELPDVIATSNRLAARTVTRRPHGESPGVGDA